MHMSFYRNEKTDGPALGGFQPLTRPHLASGAQRDSQIQSAGRGSPPRSWPDLRDGEVTVSSFIHDPREFAALCFVGALLSAVGCMLFILIFFASELFDFG